MKGNKLFIFTLFTILLLASSALAVVWDGDGFSWLSSNDSNAILAGKHITIHDGYSAEFGTGDFYSPDDKVNVEILLYESGNMNTPIATLYDSNVETTTFTAYEKVTVNQAQYGSTGNYVIWMWLRDQGQKHESGSITLTVLGNAVITNQPPVADFTYTPANPEAKEVVYFTSTSYDPDGDSLSHSWNLNNDGVTDSTSANPTYTFPAAGNYPVTLTVSDGSLTDSITKVIVVKPAVVTNQPPTADFMWTPLYPEINEQVQFAPTFSDPENDPLTWTWDLDGDGVVDSTDKYPTFSYLAVGNYYVTLTVSDPTHDVPVTKTLTVVEPAPKVVITDITGHDPIYQGDVQDITVEVRDNNNNVIADSLVEVFYKKNYCSESDGSYWRFIDCMKIFFNHEDIHIANCNTDATGSCTISYQENNKPGDETVYAKAYKQGYEADTDTKPDFTYTILEQVMLTTEIIAVPLSGDAPLTVDFDHNTQNAQGPLTFNWDFEGDGTIDSMGETPQFTFGNPGVYVVTLTVSDGVSIAKDTEVITVNIPPQGLKTEIVANPTIGEAPLTVNFGHITTGAQGPLTFNWDFDGDGAFDSTDETPQFTYTQPGDYTVWLVVSDGVSTASDTITITVEQPKELAVKIHAYPTEGHAPLTVHFSYEVFYADCDVTASWDFDGDGLHDSSAPYVTYTYDTAGTYTVTLVITDCHGNTAKDEVVITVYPETPTKNTATKMIQWTQLNLVNGEVYKPGDDLPVLINFKNQGNLDLEGVKVSVFVPELALYRTVGPFTLYDGEEITKVIVLDLPNGAEKGTYDLRVNIDTTGDEKMHRIMYRSFEIQ